jgi:hypothetical protein
MGGKSMRQLITVFIVSTSLFAASCNLSAGSPLQVNPVVQEGISQGDIHDWSIWEGFDPALDQTDDRDTLWWTGNIDHHILGGQSISWSPVLPQQDQTYIKIKYGLWNSPEVPLEVWVNSSYVGTCYANFGYISPGPKYAVANITNYLVSGINLIEIIATSGGEAVIGYVGVGVRGVYDYLAGDVETIPEHVSIDLNSPIPNPFNPKTMLNFTLPEAAKVNLVVYNVNGRQVAELVNGWREAGTHQVAFDGSLRASGMYFCHLTVGPEVIIGKMMLVK